MLVTLIILSLALLSGLLFWYYRAAGVDAVYERLNYGFPEPEEEIEEDLTDPAYGLTGNERRLQNLNYFLSHWKGKLAILITGAVLGYLISSYFSVSVELQGASSIGLSLVLFLTVVSLINRRSKRRKNDIKKELPYALEMLAALMKGGLAFETSLQHVIRESERKHPLYFEFTTMYESMQRGRRRADAFRLLDQRCDVFEVTELASAVIQVDQTGGSIGDVMRHHAKTIFRENEADIRRRAEKLPVKMMFPMILTIFPSLFVVLLLPNLLRLFRVMDE
ncbi:MAG: type II secretion system F family protein, partial [Thiotrichales bacterium]|nr:type II secretion system F family protein [Thiotrichales bacterium]